MKNGEVMQTGESIGAPARSRTTPPDRILVVDDDRDLRVLSVDVLVRSGDQVDTAEDGAAGWEALCANNEALSQPTISAAASRFYCG